MAEVKFLSESEYDGETHQYVIEVTADLGDGDVRRYEQTVVFEAEKAQELAQSYADEMEKQLKEQKAAEEKAAAETEDESTSDE